MMKKRVVLGMSGGVDSAVAAYLLREQGYEVIGVTMQVWQDDEGFKEREGGCCSLSAVDDARMVADTLGIPFYVMNFKEVFREKVIDYFVEEYVEGRTPNPCIACNKYIKFDELLHRAEALGADYVATGHYARIYEKDGRMVIEKAEDDTKDQTYALYNLTQEQLRKTLMPCGDYRKTRIREIAKEMDLGVHNKRDSQEICFIDDNNHGRYIYEVRPELKVEGNFVDEKGNVLGRHKGIAYYTIGQRKGLGLSLGKPYFVSKIDKNRNEVVLTDESALFKTTLIAGTVNWVSREAVTEPYEALAKIRYSAKPAPCTIYPLENGQVKVIFNEKQRAMTAGQAVVFYEDNFLLGGGTILEVLD
ncbi:tRNA 2-thiouridine(34) synthase MnmA [Proteiniclasticum sp. BAD-10]|uniref:tRNA-specific 2-thiouridylase MnmA n=1 Tax=Proteiniclasticum sediminis TaxID=2804028 RepID=A0A941CP78_9CLOT|nr:tRNA 2-thiouridine(34) synthase MnmA [Proteiniclasticum sediminis]